MSPRSRRLQFCGQCYQWKRAANSQEVSHASQDKFCSSAAQCSSYFFSFLLLPSLPTFESYFSVFREETDSATTHQPDVWVYETLLTEAFCASFRATLIIVLPPFLLPCLLFTSSFLCSFCISLLVFIHLYNIWVNNNQVFAELNSWNSSKAEAVDIFADLFNYLYSSDLNIV